MTVTQTNQEERKSPHRRVLSGVVVSDKMQKTIVVKVDRRVTHGRYMKYVTVSKKYKVHDEKEEANQGDLVEIVECRPLSRQKNWALKKIVRKSSLAGSDLSTLGEVI